MRVVDYVIDEVYKAGAKHAFTITGGGAMFINDAVAAHPVARVRLISAAPALSSRRLVLLLHSDALQE